MVQISTNEFRAGIKIEVDGQPYTIIEHQFVRPGKGQAFNRVRMRHLLSQRVVEKTFKSGETVELADVGEKRMRLLYVDHTGVTFMDDESFEQLVLPLEKVKDMQHWLVEDIVYDLIFYKGEVTTVEPPTFMEMEIVETTPGARGDTSGRVLKPATTSSGATIKIPIFIDQGELVKIDTRTGEYVSRVNK